MKTRLYTRKRALISSVAMLLVAMIALGTATFAWFTRSTSTTAEGLNVKTIKSTDDNFSHALAEVSKYSVKDADYIIPHKWKLSQETVKTLDLALHRRRLVAFGGIVKQVHKKLNLDDPLDGDLTHIDKDSVADATTQNLVSYFWHQGYQQYFKIN